MPLTWPNYNEARSPNSWFRGLPFVSHFSFFFARQGRSINRWLALLNRTCALAFTSGIEREPNKRGSHCQGHGLENYQSQELSAHLRGWVYISRFYAGVFPVFFFLPGTCFLLWLSAFPGNWLRFRISSFARCQ